MPLERPPLSFRGSARPVISQVCPPFVILLGCPRLSSRWGARPVIPLGAPASVITMKIACRAPTMSFRGRKAARNLKS